MSYKIDSSFEIPSSRKRTRYPFDQMKVGDSFLIPKTDYKERVVMQTKIATAAKRNGFKAVTRSEDGGIRVWRAA